MGSTVVLDLRGIALPASLLECNRALMGLGEMDTLDVLVHDPEVAEDMVRIIQRSRKRTIHSQREGNFFRIRVGPDTREHPAPDPGPGANGTVPKSPHSDNGR